MLYGNTELKKLPLGTRVKVLSNGPFIVYGYRDKERVYIYGPTNVNDRVCKIRTQHEHIEVRAMDDVQYNMDIVTPDDTKEVISKESMTLTVEDVGESTEDRFRRIIRQEMSMAVAQQEVESFEEADDFEVEDDDDLIGRSGYEITDMQEMHEFQPYGSNDVSSEEVSDGTEDAPDTGTDDPEPPSEVSEET